MNMPMGAPLPGNGSLPQKGAGDYPQKFEDIAPGSRVRVTGEGIEEPVIATVLETMAEYGATSVPAMTIVDDRTNEPYIITASGRYDVQIVLDASVLAANAIAPAGAQRVRLIAVYGEAAQFKGGQESAAEIVRWLIGTRAPQYKQPTDTEPDRLEFGGINAAVCRPGDWIIKHEDKSVHIFDSKTFPATYEEAL